RVAESVCCEVAADCFLEVPVGREPIAVVNAVRLVLLAAIAFGLHLTDVQLVASMAALEAVLTLFTRSRVTPS
ncbi:MAG: hypothetical protein ACOYXU_02035, partial [Nitrospirota bacterium]